MNNTDDIYIRYVESRDSHNISAFDSHIIAKKNDITEAFINNHKRMINEINAVDNIAKDITKDIIKEFESMIKTS